MRPLYIILFFLFVHNQSVGQIIHEAPERLLRLNAPVSVRTRYVNFDVLKLMIGQGFAWDQNGAGRLSPCFTTQILCPFAKYKNNKVHVAYGVTIGSARMGFKKARLVTMGTANDVVHEATNEYMIQKTTHFGFVILPFFQPTKWLTFYAGSGLDFNLLGNKIFSKPVSGKKIRYSSRRFVNKVSVPLQVQLSHRLGQTASVGLYGSYDLLPRFKNPAGQPAHQAIVGLSMALIL
jgi:hypothetical protein